MKKRLLSTIIVLVLIIGLFPITVFADAPETYFFYIDADTLEPIPNLFQSNVETFVLKQPDGILLTFESDGYYESEGMFYVVIDWYSVIEVQAGKYTLVSYPIPNGYEVVKISGFVKGKGSYAEENDGFIFTENNKSPFPVINIYLRKTENLVAIPTSSNVLVNGENISFDAYNINGNNYFKLRDLAYILSGTEKQFDVGWDGVNNAISLISGKAYTTVGGEMASKGKENKTPTPTNSKIYLDGVEVKFTAYTIDGNNYFKLRDVGETFNFGVDWDSITNTVIIDTSKSYTP